MESPIHADVINARGESLPVFGLDGRVCASRREQSGQRGSGRRRKIAPSQSYQVNNTNAAVTLSGGTITRAGSVTEVFGNLNVTTTSFLDYGSGTAGTLQFQGYLNTGSSLVTIANFLPGNKLQFLSSSFGTNNLGQFSFSSGYTTSTDGSYFTITAVPEASTMAAAVALLVLCGCPFIRRLASKTGD